MSGNVLFFIYRNDNVFDEYVVFNGEIKKQIEEANNYCYNHLPIYTDRSNILNRERKVIDKETIDDATKFLLIHIDLNNYQIVYELHIDKKLLLINYKNKIMTHNGHSYTHTISRNKTTITCDKHDNYFIRILFNNSDSYMKAYTNNLNKSESKVFYTITSSKEPLSRKNIAYITGYSDRAVSYALKELQAQKMIKNVRETKSNKSNKYVIYKRA